MKKIIFLIILGLLTTTISYGAEDDNKFNFEISEEKIHIDGKDIKIKINEDDIKGEISGDIETLKDMVNETKKKNQKTNFVVSKYEDKVSFGNDIVVSENQSFKDIVSIGGDVDIYGNVDGDVIAILGDVSLHKNASITKDCVVVGGKLILDEESYIGGDQTEIFSFNVAKNILASFFSLGSLKGQISLKNQFQTKIGLFLLFLVLGILVTALISKNIENISLFIKKEPYKSSFAGFVSFLLIVPCILLLVITIIGIFLIPFFIIAVFAGIFIGYIAICFLIGKQLLEKRKKSIYLYFLVGLLILNLIGLIPYVGFVAMLIASIVGLGSILLTKFGTKQFETT